MQFWQAFIIASFLQGAFLPLGAQNQDPDMIPPEVLLPLPGAPRAVPPAQTIAPTAQAGAGISAPMMQTRAALMQQGAQQMPLMQGIQGMQGAQYGAASIPIQAFVPAGWPFDGMAPPSGAPAYYPPAAQQNMAASSPVQASLPASNPYASPSVGVIGGEASGINSAVVPGQLDAVDTEASSAAGPFSTDKECLLCKKKKGADGQPLPEGVGSDQIPPAALISTGPGAGTQMTQGATAGSAAATGQSGQVAAFAGGAQSMPQQQMAASGQRPGSNAPLNPNSDPVAVIQTTQGTITIRLFQQYAPQTVANFVDLIKKGFYNGLRWHRVVPGFVIQAGCPKGDGTGGYIDQRTGKPRNVPLELHQRLRHNAPGVVAMARFGNDPNSGSSQFYITLAPKAQLDNKYSVFGGVVSGMEVVQKIGTQDKILGITLQH